MKKNDLFFKRNLLEDGKRKKERKRSDSLMPMYFLYSCSCTFQRLSNYLTHLIWFPFQFWVRKSRKNPFKYFSMHACLYWSALVQSTGIPWWQEWNCSHLVLRSSLHTNDRTAFRRQLVLIIGLLVWYSECKDNPFLIIPSGNRPHSIFYCIL